MARRIRAQRKRKRKREPEIHYLRPVTAGPPRHPMVKGSLTARWEPKK